MQNRILHTDRAYTQSQLIEATNFFNQQLRRPAVRVDPRADGRRAARAARGHRRADDGGGRRRRGRAGRRRGAGRHRRAQPAATPATSRRTWQRLRRLFDLFEQKTSLLHLLDVSQRAQGVQIYIGGESGLVPLDECSVVTAPYEVERPGDRHARRHRPDADGVRARDPDRRRHGQAAVERAVARVRRRLTCVASLRGPVAVRAPDA